MALLGDEAGDAVAFLAKIDRIGWFVYHFIEVVIKAFSPIPSEILSSLRIVKGNSMGFPFFHAYTQAQ